MHLFWMEKKKKKFHRLNRSSLLVGSTLIVNRPNLRDRTESDVSKSVTSVTLCSCGETSAGERECVKHFQSKSLRSSHRGRGGGVLPRTTSWIRIGKRRRDRTYCTYASTHTHTHALTPSPLIFSPRVFVSVTSSWSYITFSNSCMDLIMVSSCREGKGAIREQ